MRLESVVRIVWLFTGAIFIGVGIGLIWWPSSQAIDSLRLEASHYYDEANTNEADVRHAAELEAVQDRVEADLRSLTPASSPSQATTLLVRLLADESRRFHVSIRSIVPGNAAPASTGSFDKNDVALTLNGRFFDVLHFVADIPRRDSLLDIHDMTLADADRRGTSPMLTVTLHTTLYRFRGSAREGESHAPRSV